MLRKERGDDMSPTRRLRHLLERYWRGGAVSRVDWLLALDCLKDIELRQGRKCAACRERWPLGPNINH